jgi:hypothetical protein
VQGSKGYKVLKEFKSLEEFKVFLSHLQGLSYYNDFKLLLCSSCNIALNPTNLKGHFARYFLDLKGKAKAEAVLRAIGVLQELEVSPLSLSLNLITSFSTTHTFFPFLELNTLRGGLYKCAFCPYIVLNKLVVQRHLREQHSHLKFSSLSKTYTFVARGQSLESTKYYFQIETKDKGKETQGTRGEEEEELHSPLSASLIDPLKEGEEEEDPFT